MMSKFRLPAPCFTWLTALFMGGVMTAVVTACLQLPFIPSYKGGLERWIGNWFLAWAIATPMIVLVAPRARALATRFAIPPEAGR
jgi:amino acid transporter